MDQLSCLSNDDRGNLSAPKELYQDTLIIELSPQKSIDVRPALRNPSQILEHALGFDGNVALSRAVDVSSNAIDLEDFSIQQTLE